MTLNRPVPIVSNEPEHSASRDRWILAAICVTPLVGLLNAFALSPFLPAIADEMHTTVALVGQVPATMQLVAAVLGLIVGPLADRYGYRRMLLVGTVALLICALGTVASQTFLTLLIAAVVGAGSRAILQPVSITVAGSHFHGKARLRAIGLVTAAISGAGTVGIPLLTTVAAMSNWRGAFVALAMLAILAAVLVAIGLPGDVRPTSVDRISPRVLFSAYTPLLRDSSTLGLIGSSFFRSCGQWCAGTYVVAFLVQEHNLTAQIGGLALALSGLGQILGSVMGTGWFARFPARPVLAIVAILVGVTSGGSMALPIGTEAVFVLVGLGSIVSGIGNVTVTNALLSETRAGRGTTLTLQQSGFSLASAVGGSIGGLLLALGGYHWVGMGVPVFCTVAAVLVLVTRRREAVTTRSPLA